VSLLEFCCSKDFRNLHHEFDDCHQIVTQNDHDAFFSKANDAHKMSASAKENQAAISDCCWWVVVVKGDIFLPLSVLMQKRCLKPL